MTSPPGKRLRLSDPSTMASTSASPVVQKSYEYDVFLSFRGDDTRKTFVDHLYLALNKKGIRTYKDDVRIEKGEKISEQLIRSIEESRFFIIVFSKNYADSSWCLQELVKIMECQQMKAHTAYPIFYDVEPTELRKQIGAVGEAFKKHVEKEDAEKWRDALKEAAGLAGWDLKNMFDGYEAKLIQKCVQDISLKPHFTSSSIDGKLVGMENRGTDATKSIKVMISNFPPETLMKGLKKMKGLRFLYVYGDDDTIWDFDQAKHKYQYLPNSLRSVNWLRYPFWCLPKTFEANMLVCLKMGLSNISQLWEGDDIKVLNKLKILDLSFTKLKTFDLQITPKLERLNLAGCEDFVELLMPVRHVKLSYLNLSFSKVSKLNLESIPNLGSLDLSSCNKFVELHMPLKCRKLSFLNLSETKVSSLNLGLTPYLESLVLQDCENFVELHIPIESPKLKFLDLSGSKVININLKLIPNLESLHLAHCEEFAELHMLVELPKLKFLELRGSKVISLNLGLTPHLEWLDLEGCYNLQEIHDPMGCLKKLKSLNLIGCLRFQDVLFNESNTFLGLESHSILELIADPLDICPLHPNSTLPKFYFKCSFQREDINPLPPKKHNSFNLCACTNIESFYETLCGLQHLTRLTLVAHIPEVPKDLGQLKSLVELNLRMKEIKHLPDSICMLKHLTRLELYSCCLLEKLPDDIDRLERLERLDLAGCTSLQYIPNNICNMKRLLRLDLHFCIGVKKLPEQVGHLKCLQILRLEEAGVSCLPQSISQIRGLRITGSRCLLESSGFTSLVETYTSSGQFFAYTET